MPIGDGHDLQSRRFAGDPVLEACYDGEHRMTLGEEGAAVRKLQEALLFLQYPLPQWGADGKFGNETAGAVAQFKLDHHLAPADGVVGPKTMAELERIFLLQESSPFTVTQVALMTDDYSRVVDWNAEVIALSPAAQTVNLQIEGVGFLNDTPSVVTVALSTRLPNHAAGQTSLPVPVAVDTQLVEAPMSADAPGKSVFRRTVTLTELGIPGLAQAGVLKIATVIRANETAEHSGPATSDAHLRQGLAGVTWLALGHAQQPNTIDPVTHRPHASGAVGNEAPDALALLRSGGLEVLAVTVNGLVSKALVRNPAHLLYYSGHGLYRSNCLAVFVPGSGHYECWAKAEDLLPVWTPDLRLHTLLIAGCSVLSLNFDNPAASPGSQWAKLTKAKGGPLTALLGYGSLKADPTTAELFAPKDEPVGNAIAQAMGQRIAAGSVDLVADWLTINADHRAWNAVAIDGNGFYWWLEKEALGFSHIKHSRALP